MADRLTQTQLYESNKIKLHLWLMREIGFRNWLAMIRQTIVCDLVGHDWSPDRVEYADYWVVERWRECQRCEKFEALPR